LCALRSRHGGDEEMVRVRQRRLSTQILWLQLAILVITLLVGLGLSLRALRHELDRSFEQQALRVAQSVAADPGIAQAIVDRDPDGLIQQRAEAVRRQSGALFVVVTDDRRAARSASAATVSAVISPTSGYRVTCASSWPATRSRTSLRRWATTSSSSTAGPERSTAATWAPL
jgi:hypothetical protein